MSTVEEIEQAIITLSPVDYKRLRERMAKLEEEAWDRQIAEDCAAGRLDHIIAEVDADIDGGRFRKL